MPQAHNPSIMADKDSGALGKNSRFMNASKFTERTLRRMNAINKVDQRETQSVMSVFSRNWNIDLARQERIRNRLFDGLNKKTAYRLVINKHPIAKNPHYKEALDENYTLHSFRHEIRDMLHQMSPDTIREKRARALVRQSQASLTNAMQRGRESIEQIFPRKRHPWEIEDEKKEEEEEVSETPPPPKPFGQRPFGQAAFAQAARILAPVNALRGKVQHMSKGLIEDLKNTRSEADPSEASINPYAALPSIAVGDRTATSSAKTVIAT